MVNGPKLAKEMRNKFAEGISCNLRIYTSASIYTHTYIQPTSILAGTVGGPGRGERS